MDSFNELKNVLLENLEKEKIFFGAMLDKETLGKIIEIASKEDTYEAKATKFLKLLEDIEKHG